MAFIHRRVPRRTVPNRRVREKTEDDETIRPRAAACDDARLTCARDVVSGTARKDAGTPAGLAPPDARPLRLLLGTQRAAHPCRERRATAVRSSGARAATMSASPAGGQ